MTRALAKPAAEPGKGKSKDKHSKPARPPRELREVLASPGHPIDPGLRGELEAKLGHDFSRVRVHNDPDAAAVTELLGADAVTVGQDIFFAKAMFRPETTDGRRLLVHELLHTVQVPDALGALREGRDTGAVSTPGEPLEREAEDVARSGEPERQADRVRQGAAWMRYATVDADRMRTEQLDPATLVDRLVAGVLRSLRGDPSDVSGRVRAQLARFTPELRHTVLIKLETRLPSSDYARVLEWADEADTEAGGPVETPNVPEPVPDNEPEPDPEPSPEPEPQEPEPSPEEKPEPSADEKEPEKPKEEKTDEEKKKEDEEKKEEEDKDKKDEKEAGKEEKKPEEAPAGEAAPAEVPGAQAPGAPGAGPAAGQGPPAGAAPMPEGGLGAAEPVAAAPEKVEAAAEAPDSPLVQHGLLERPGQDDRVEEQEKPIGLEPAADNEVEVPEPEEPKSEEDEQPEPPALKPEDHLPSTDLDVSNVPTADQITLPATGSPPPQQQAPSFASPPPTKADQAEQAEPEAPTPEAPAPIQTAADPAAEEEPPAEQPLEAEVGPDPTTTDAATAPVPAEQPPQPEERAAEPEPIAPEPAAERAPAMGAPGPAGGADAGMADAGPAAMAEQPGEVDTAPAPEASLEKDGGGCEGAPAPAAAEPDAGGGCGGGGGAPPAEAAPEPAPPDVSAQPPEAALATVSTLPPDKMESALSGVDSAVSHDVGERQTALQGAPPTMQRPSGAPQTMSGPPEVAPQADAEKITLKQAEAQQAEQKKQEEAKQVQGENNAGQAPRPHVAGDTEGHMSADEIENVQQAVENVPTTDPALNTTVGAAPKVELTGVNDPKRTDEQTGELKDASAKIHATGQQEAGKNLGEHRIFPNAPPQTLTGQIPSAGGEGGGGPAAGPAGPGGADAGVAVVAQQERGPQIQAGVAEGRTQMGTERDTQQQGETKANADHEAEVTATVQENADAQAAERGKVAEDATAKREEWRAEQDKKIEESNAEADKEHDTAKTGIHKEKTDTDKEAEDQKKEDNDKITHEREQAEEKARKEKEDKKKESEGGGFFSWLASKVASFFEGLLNAITAIFDAAVSLVNGIIKTFASIVTGLIDLARKAIVGLINVLANVLLKLCDVLAVFFPELAAKIRKQIEDLRDAAIAAVNKLADALKAGVEFLLNKLAEALTGLLRLLEKGLKAAVDVVRKAVNAAIEFAKAAIQMLGEFAAIIADIASMGVGPWLGKLGSSAKEGIQNHLWGAIKSAVKTWFNEKVEAVLGLGKAVINTLIKGCFSMAKIGKMAWDAIIASLPMIIITVVIERLVSLIIPAAGAVLAVIQGLMAAWGTISKILAAIGAFMAFLKAVKAGQAACLFAKAVAAGVVALLEFITNFLMAKLASAAKGVGRSLKGIASKIMKGLGRAGKGARKAAGRAVNSARTGMKKVGQALRPKGRGPRPARPTRAGRPARPGRPERAGRPGRPARTPARAARKNPLTRVKSAVRNGVRKAATALKKVGKKIANSKIGKAIKNTAKKLRDKYTKMRDKFKAKAKARKDQKAKRDTEKNSPQAKQRRLELIVARIKPKLERLLKMGVRGRVLNGVLLGFRTFYRLTALKVEGAQEFLIRAILNPDQPVVLGKSFNIANIDIEVDRMLRAVRKIGQEIEESGAARNSETATQRARTKETTLPMASGGDRQAVLAESKAGGAEVHAALRRRKVQPETKSDAVQLLSDTVDPLTVIRRFRSRNRRQKPNPRNRLVDVTDPTSGKPKGVSYPEFKNILKNTGKEQEIAQDALGLLAARAPRGTHPQLAAEVNIWAMHGEGHRNIGALATQAMALDAAARGEMSLQKAVDIAPMSPGGAPTQSKHAVRYLNEVREKPVRTDRKWVLQADQLAQREMNMIKVWVESLKDLKIKDAATQKEKETALILEVRKRIHKMYGLKGSDMMGAEDFLKRVDNEHVIL
ncbi:eCIS core domain-containing protein [Amycolatopsis sp.]|uniref:eCIS core domain-containing protein n=1 Tax=Amycolatopsis sp. TaxID=37632 RepID=UPI002DFF7D75|nr:DUF4157 domain-containing protein [Amycolatopsis sp.]